MAIVELSFGQMRCQRPLILYVRCWMMKRFLYLKYIFGGFTEIAGLERFENVLDGILKWEGGAESIEK